MFNINISTDIGCLTYRFLSPNSLFKKCNFNFDELLEYVCFMVPPQTEGLNVNYWKPILVFYSSDHRDDTV